MWFRILTYAFNNYIQTKLIRYWYHGSRKLKIGNSKKYTIGIRKLRTGFHLFWNAITVVWSTRLNCIIIVDKQAQDFFENWAIDDSSNNQVGTQYDK